MCGRFFRHEVSWDVFHDWLNLIPPDNVDPPEAKYNIAPMSYAPVIRKSPETAQLELFPCLWGLVPSWWSKPLSEKKFSTFNAKSETLNEAASFSRCLSS